MELFDSLQSNLLALLTEQVVLTKSDGETIFVLGQLDDAVIDIDDVELLINGVGYGLINPKILQIRIRDRYITFVDGSVLRPATKEEISLLLDAQEQKSGLPQPGQGVIPGVH